jgi:hypothetical protein
MAVVMIPDRQTANKVFVIMGQHNTHCQKCQWQCNPGSGVKHGVGFWVAGFIGYLVNWLVRYLVKLLNHSFEAICTDVGRPARAGKVRKKLRKLEDRSLGRAGDAAVGVG